MKMAVTKSLPWAVAGGSDHRAGPTPDQFPCAVQHRLDAIYKLDRAHTERWGGWFEIAGIKLDTETTQSTDTLTRLIPDNNTPGNDEQNPKYCSSGTLIRDSAWVAEVR